MELNCCKPRPELPVSNDDEDEVEFSHTGSNRRDHDEGHCLEKDQKIKDKEKDEDEEEYSEDESDPDNDPKTDLDQEQSVHVSRRPLILISRSLPRRPLESGFLHGPTSANGSIYGSISASIRLKTSSWGKDLNNCSDTNDWRQAERSHINAPPISAPRINFISESEPISMTIPTEESEKQEKGSSEYTHSLPEVKTLFDDCEMGDERKMFKLHKKSPELPSHNSNKGLLESRNTDYFSATTPGLLDGKREFESHKYTKNTEGADNKSMLYQARRPVKSSHLEKPHELNTYEIYYKDGKELEINKKLD